MSFIKINADLNISLTSDLDLILSLLLSRSTSTSAAAKSALPSIPKQRRFKPHTSTSLKARTRLRPQPSRECRRIPYKEIREEEGEIVGLGGRGGEGFEEWECDLERR
jgi:hypothetical protein